jgi:hypothetical protein
MARRAPDRTGPGKRASTSRFRSASRSATMRAMALFVAWSSSSQQALGKDDRVDEERADPRQPRGILRPRHRPARRRLFRRAARRNLHDVGDRHVRLGRAGARDGRAARSASSSPVWRLAYPAERLSGWVDRRLAMANLMGLGAAAEILLAELFVQPAAVRLVMVGFALPSRFAEVRRP